MLPEMRLLFQQYFDIVDCVCSIWGRYILIHTCVFSNKLFIFRCWAYLMTVIPETRRSNWIWYQRFINIIPTWFHVFIQDRGGYIYKNTHVVFWHIIFPDKILRATIYRPWLLLFVVFRWNKLIVILVQLTPGCWLILIFLLVFYFLS